VGKYYASILAALFMLHGCASGPAYSPQSGMKEDEAVVYVFRPKSWTLSALSAIINIDEKQVVLLENNGYAAISIPAGAHTISEKWKAGLIGNSQLENGIVAKDFYLRSGEEVFIRLGVQSESKVQYRTINSHFAWQLKQVSKSDAQEELTLCRRATLLKN
jgi:hypothetical protein